MRGRRLVILLVIIRLILLPAAAALSQEEATTLVLSQVIETSENKNSLRAHRWNTPVLSAKEKYQPEFTFDEPVWLFWIDDKPGMQFAHPNRYVFVHQDGFIRISGANWQPENLNEAELFYIGKPGFFEKLILFIRGLL